MWIARNRYGELKLYLRKPIKRVNEGIWFAYDTEILAYLPDNYFPEVKWSDEEPRELVLKPIKEAGLQKDIKLIKKARIMTGEELIKSYKSDNRIWNNGKKAPRNSMGCSEYWYYDEYAVCRTFSEEEILDMSEKEIDNLLKLANSIGEALY